MSVHRIIDEFVSRLDTSGSNFRRVEIAPWIDALEAELQKRFPLSFRSLVTRYAFPKFDAGNLSFFANTGGDSPEELSVAIFDDRAIADAVLKAGYIQFARPGGGSYDPICFDAGRAVSNREFPVVRLDHEEILCRERILVSDRVADSFYRFVAGFVGHT